MARLTPEEFAEKHARRLKGSVEDIRTGVGRVTTAPGQQAAKKADKMLANLTKRVQDGTWAKRVAGVSLEDWKGKVIDKGLGRIATGIDSAHAKVVDFAGQLLPAVDTAQAKVKGLPDLTLEDSINRMNTFIREMAKFSKK